MIMTVFSFIVNTMAADGMNNYGIERFLRNIRVLRPEILYVIYRSILKHIYYVVVI